MCRIDGPRMPRGQRGYDGDLFEVATAGLFFHGALAFMAVAVGPLNTAGYAVDERGR